MVLRKNVTLIFGRRTSTSYDGSSSQQSINYHLPIQSRGRGRKVLIRVKALTITTGGNTLKTNQIRGGKFATKTSTVIIICCDLFRDVTVYVVGSIHTLNRKQTESKNSVLAIIFLFRGKNANSPIRCHLLRKIRYLQKLAEACCSPWELV